jgi:hypothetical protein
MCNNIIEIVSTSYLQKTDKGGITKRKTKPIYMTIVYPNKNNGSVAGIIASKD